MTSVVTTCLPFVPGNKGIPETQPALVRRIAASRNTITADEFGEKHRPVAGKPGLVRRASFGSKSEEAYPWVGGFRSRFGRSAGTVRRVAIMPNPRERRTQRESGQGDGCASAGWVRHH